VDVALGPFSLIFNRFRVAEPSNLVFEDFYSILSSAQTYAIISDKLGLKTLVSMFDSHIWLLIIFSIFILALVITTADLIFILKTLSNPLKYAVEHSLSTSINVFRRYLSLVFMLIGTLLRQGIGTLFC